MLDGRAIRGRTCSPGTALRGAKTSVWRVRVAVGGGRRSLSRIDPLCTTDHWGIGRGRTTVVRDVGSRRYVGIDWRTFRCSTSHGAWTGPIWCFFWLVHVIQEAHIVVAEEATWIRSRLVFQQLVVIKSGLPFCVKVFFGSFRRRVGGSGLGRLSIICLWNLLLRRNLVEKVIRSRAFEVKSRLRLIRFPRDLRLWCKAVLGWYQGFATFQSDDLFFRRSSSPCLQRPKEVVIRMEHIVLMAKCWESLLAMSDFKFRETFLFLMLSLLHDLANLRVRHEIGAMVLRFRQSWSSWLMRIMSAVQG